MGILGSLLGILGFGVGISIGLIVGYFLFIYFEPTDVKLQDYPESTAFDEIEPNTLVDLLPELPLWVMNPDYERVNWFNDFIANMWPYLDKSILANIR